MLATLTLKQKILATVTLAVVVSCLLVGYFSQRSAQQLIENRMFEQELPNLTQRISKEIEQDLHGIAQAARQLATDRFILDWVDRGMPKEQEPILINQLKDVANQYGLVTASFADRQTAAYYNQDGFLRNLTPTQDAWFYDYTKSQKEMTLSIFRESNGEVKLFRQLPAAQRAWAGGLCQIPRHHGDHGLQLPAGRERHRLYGRWQRQGEAAPRG